MTSIKAFIKMIITTRLIEFDSEYLPEARLVNWLICELPESFRTVTLRSISIRLSNERSEG